MLPQDFTERMRRMLGEEAPAFFAEMERAPVKALRVNTGKIARETFLAKAPFSLAPVPWAADGFYYDSADAPGRHPWHEAGAYYIQEASAMAPVTYLMRPSGGEGKVTYQDERILDLCAAPGGKSTQIAAAMRGEGLLICNEIHPARAKILSENVERMGVCNAVVTNESPQRLAGRFRGYFTRILVDAPCSGEGMFRKNGEACAEWSLANVGQCAARQDAILDCAAEMLAPGGRLVYATCTFAPREDEGSIARFLTRHAEFVVEEAPLSEGFASGRPEWGGETVSSDVKRQLVRTIRLWPHRLRGEGHYLAVLRKEGELRAGQGAAGVQKGVSDREAAQPGGGVREYLEFARETLGEEGMPAAGDAGRWLRFGEQLYRMPQGTPELSGLRILRPGLHLGTIKKGRFEPSHALALALHPGDARRHAQISETAAASYLRGETFPWEGEKGWYLVTVDGCSVGWGKLSGGVMRNHYPKGLRKGG